MKKLIDIKQEDVNPLKIKAVKNGKSFKKYLEDLLSKHASTENDL